MINVQASLCLTENPDVEDLSDQMRERLNFYPEDVELLAEKRQVVDAWVDTVQI